MAKYRPGEPEKTIVGPRPTMRLDKWLWQARFFRTRTLASHEVAQGHIRVNGTPTAKPAIAVGLGDTLTIPQGNRVRLIRVLALGERRGPAGQAQGLYLDLDAPEGGVGIASPLE